MSDTKQKVKEIIVKQLGVHPEQVTDEASIGGDLGADSLDFVELVMALEENFAIEIPDEDIYDNKQYLVNTISDLVACVEKYEDRDRRRRRTPSDKNYHERMTVLRKSGLAALE